MHTKKTSSILPIFLLIIALCIPFWKINYGVEPGDTFFSHNQYIFFEEQPTCVNLPLFFTMYLGNLLTEFADFIGVSSILLTRSVYAIIKVIAAILVYILLRKKAGKYITVFSIFFAFLLEKAAFNNFYYSGISLYGYTIFLILLLLGLERKSAKLITVSAFLCSLCVFCRISNIVYIFSYILILPHFNGGDKSFFSKSIKATAIGFLTGLALIGIVIDQTIGLHVYSQIIENVQASEIDGHGVFPLLCRTFKQYVSGVVIFFCFYIVFFPLSLLTKSARTKNRFLYSIIYCALFLISSVFIWFDPYLFNVIPGKRVMYFIHLFTCMAIYTFSVSCIYFHNQRRDLLSTYRLVIATTIYGLIGHFGSLSSLGLMTNCFCLIMPVLVHVCLVISNDLSNAPSKLLRCISASFETVVLASSVALAFCFFAFMTFTVCEFNRPNPANPMWTYEELNSHRILKGMKLTPSERKKYSELSQQIQPHVTEGTPLLSLTLPYCHALLNMPPFLKWQGGWTWLTSPKSMQQQLLQAEIKPVIIIPHFPQTKYAHYEEHLEVVRSYIHDNDYVNIYTASFNLYIPRRAVRQESR